MRPRGVVLALGVLWVVFGMLAVLSPLTEVRHRYDARFIGVAFVAVAIVMIIAELRRRPSGSAPVVANPPPVDDAQDQRADSDRRRGLAALMRIFGIILLLSVGPIIIGWLEHNPGLIAVGCIVLSTLVLFVNLRLPLLRPKRSRSHTESATRELTEPHDGTHLD